MNLLVNIYERMRWEGHVARMGGMRNAYSPLVGKSDGKSPLGIPKRRWEDNLRMGLREMVWKLVDSMDLV